MDAEQGKLTEQRTSIIVEAIAGACPKYFACQKAGIDYATFKRWMSRGKREADDLKSAYRAFRAAVKSAEAECVSRNAELIQHAATSGTWQAAAWTLERLHPQYFGSQRHEIAEMKRRLEELERERGQSFGSQPTPATTRNGTANGHTPH